MLLLSYRLGLYYASFILLFFMHNTSAQCEDCPANNTSTQYCDRITNESSWTCQNCTAGALAINYCYECILAYGQNETEDNLSCTDGEQGYTAYSSGSNVAFLCYDATDGGELGCATCPTQQNSSTFDCTTAEGNSSNPGAGISGVGWYLNSSGQLDWCSDAIPGCQDCSGSTPLTCTQAFADGWTFSEGQAPVECSYDPMCDTCVQGQEATTCTTWFGQDLNLSYNYVANMSIVWINQIDTFAMSISADGTTITCPFGFFQHPAFPLACFSCTANLPDSDGNSTFCQWNTTTDAIQLLSCVDAYYVSADGTMCLQCPDNTTNCVLNQTTGNTTVIGCISGYVQSDDECNSCGPFVQTCTMDSVGVITVTECNSSNFYISQNASCNPCPWNSVSCTNSDDSCTPSNIVCMTGYFLSGVECVPNTGLPANCDLSDPAFTSTDQNDTLPTICNYCTSGYVLNSVLQYCVPCSTNNASLCILTSQNQSIFAITCVAGFYYQNGQCLANPSNCAIAFAYPFRTDASCLHCMEGYYLGPLNVCVSCGVGVAVCTVKQYIPWPIHCQKHYKKVPASKAINGNYIWPSCVPSWSEILKPVSLIIATVSLFLALL